MWTHIQKLMLINSKSISREALDLRNCGRTAHWVDLGPKQSRFTNKWFIWKWKVTEGHSNSIWCWSVNLSSKTGSILSWSHLNLLSSNWGSNLNVSNYSSNKLSNVTRSLISRLAERLHCSTFIQSPSPWCETRLERQAWLHLFDQDPFSTGRQSALLVSTKSGARETLGSYNTFACFAWSSLNRSVPPPSDRSNCSHAKCPETDPGADFVG